ncbi:hypothetical protein PV325_012807, partial [Microctonus aethiopoides]
MVRNGVMVEKVSWGRRCHGGGVMVERSHGGEGVMVERSHGGKESWWGRCHGGEE